MDEMKKCKDCLNEFPIKTYPTDRGRPRPRCRSCFLEKKRESGIRCRKKNLDKCLKYEAAYREKNKETIKRLYKAWCSENKESTKKYASNYKKKLSPEKKKENREKRKERDSKNIERIRERKNRYFKNRKETDKSFYALERIRNSIHHFLNGLPKKSRSLAYTGCKDPLEFIEEMNKKTNESDWLRRDFQVDHIWQVHWFSEYCQTHIDNIEKIEELALIINHYSNLRPLEKTINHKRSYFDISFVTSEGFEEIKPYLNVDILSKIEGFLANRQLFSGDMIMRGSAEEQLLLTLT